MQAELERAMTARNRFYASMSHELRTPINDHHRLQHSARDHIYGPLNEKQQRGIERTHKAAKHLLELCERHSRSVEDRGREVEVDLQPVLVPT